MVNKMGYKVTQNRMNVYTKTFTILGSAVTARRRYISASGASPSSVKVVEIKTRTKPRQLRPQGFDLSSMLARPRKVKWF
jgi:hypothetical protein